MITYERLGDDPRALAHLTSRIGQGRLADQLIGRTWGSENAVDQGWFGFWRDMATSLQGRHNQYLVACVLRPAGLDPVV